jgi:two-component system, LytTR family, response regulator
MYNKTYTSLTIESQKDSLLPLTNLLKEKYPEIKNKSTLTFSTSEVDEVDFFIYEIQNINDVQGIKNLGHLYIKMIVVVHCFECIKELLLLNISSYIIPPFEATAMQNAIEKIKSSHNMENVGRKMDSVLHLQHSKKSDAIIIPTSEGFEVIRHNEIIKIMAERAYCTIYFHDNKKITVSKSLKEVEAMLPPELFIRCHLSHVINVNSIKSFRKEDGGHLLLSEGSKVPVAKNKKNELIGRLIA